MLYMKRINQPFEITQRLCFAAEDLDNITQMVAMGGCCEQVLRQIRTVQEELHMAGCLLLTLQKRESESIIRDDPSPEMRLAELMRLHEIYSEMTRFHYLNYEVNYE